MTNTNCEFGVEGPAPRNAPALKPTTPFLAACFREPGKVWGATEADLPAFVAAIRDLGATFLVLGAIPEQTTPRAQQLLWVGGDGSPDGLRRFAVHGLDFYLNAQVGSYSKPGDFGDLLTHADGTYRWDPPPSPGMRGVLYDEAEWQTLRNKMNANNGADGDGLSSDQIHPLFAPTENLGVEAAYEAVFRGAQRVVERHRQRGLCVLTEHVFPVMFHTFARAGIIACPKFLKESCDPVFAAIALGAAKQYGTEFWVAPDLWGKDGFPGHSPEEFRCSLLFAYWMGATKIFVENIHADFLDGETAAGHYTSFNSGKGLRATGLLDRQDGRYVPTEYGKVYQQFVKEYVPAHPRPYTFRDVRPEIAIVRFDDSYWGQNHSPMPKGLYGGKDVAGPASEEWIDIWHLLTHGHTSRHGLTRWNDGWDGKPHDFFYPLNNVIVYDHLVTAEHLRDVKLIIVTGLTVSEQTQNAIAEAVKNGAKCVTGDALNEETIAPFLGKPDEIRYRFGEHTLLVKRQSNDNDIRVELTS